MRRFVNKCFIGACVSSVVTFFAINNNLIKHKTQTARARQRFNTGSRNEGSDVNHHVHVTDEQNSSWTTAFPSSTPQTSDKQKDDVYLRTLLDDTEMAQMCSQFLIHNLSLQYLKTVNNFPVMNAASVIYEYKWYQLMQLPKLYFDANFRNPCFFIKAAPTCQLGSNWTVESRKVRGGAPSNSWSDTADANTADRTTGHDDGSSTGRCPLYCPELRCLPSFFFIGWPKAGSTDFFYTLKRHQKIVPTKFKEINFWDNRKLVYSPTLGVYTFRKFERCSLEFLRDVSGGSGGGNFVTDLLAADFTPAVDYGGHWEWDPLNSRDGVTPNEDIAYVQPKYLVPDRIRHVLPNAKIMAMLRHPIDRVFSFYNAWRQRNSTVNDATDFHTAVVEAVQFWTRCTLVFNLSETRCALGTFFPEGLSKPKFPRPYVYASLYSVYLADYFRVFERENILILKFEDYRQNPVEYLERWVLPFLNLEPFSESAKLEIAQVREDCNNKPVNARKHIVKFKPDTREILEKFYAPYNKRLVLMLGDKFNYS